MADREAVVAAVKAAGYRYVTARPRGSAFGKSQPGAAGRPLKKLIVLAALLVAILLVGDLLARAYAEGNIERAVEQRTDQIGHVEADIDSFPFTGRLLVTGEVPHLTITARDLSGEGTDVLEALRLDVHGLEINRSVLLDERRVRVTDVDRVTIVAELDGGVLTSLAREVGLDLVVVDDGVELSGLGTTLRAGVAVADGLVTLSAPPLPPLSIPLPPARLFPCEGSAAVVDGDVMVECETDALPEVVLDAIGAVEVES